MKKYLFTLFLLFLCFVTFPQRKYDKLVYKSEEAYNKGDYLKAIKFNDKLKKKAEKKLGQNNKYLPTYYLNAAKYNLAQGDLNEFDHYVELAITNGEVIFGENSPEYAKTLISASQMMIIYGNYTKAKQFLDGARKKLEDGNLYTEDLKAEVDLSYAHIHSGQGFYNKALEFINANDDYYKGRAVTKETYVDKSSGKLKTRRLDQDEILERFWDYADLLTLRARTLHRQGDIFEADLAYLKADNWILDNLGRNDINYITNQYHWANWFLDVGAETNDAEKMYDNALSLLKRDHQESHDLGLKLYEKLLKSYLYGNHRTKYKNLKNEYERVIKKYFEKTSMHYINLNTLQFDRKLARTSARNAEGGLATILSSHFALPKYHKKRVELLEFGYLISLNTRNYAMGEAYLNQAIEIKKELYGENSPEYHLSRIKLANHYLNFTNKHSEAIEIYNESYYGVVESQIKFGHVDYVDILNQLAKYYEENDDYEMATTTLDKALLAVREKYDDRDYEYGIELNKIAGLQIQLGQYKNAEENLNIALEILKNERRDSEKVIYYISALETRARLDAIMGEFDDAEKNLNRSHRYYRNVDELVVYDELSTIDELAGLYIYLGKYSRTEKLLQQAIKEKEDIYGNNSPKLVNSLNDLARLRLISGDYSEAEKIARRADEIAETTFGSNSTKIAPSLILLSEIYTTIGDYEKAEETISRALEIQETRFGRDHIDVAKSISQLALIKFYKGDDRKEVEDLFDEANEIIVQKLGNRSPTYAETLVQLAVLYIAEERWDDAFNTLSLAETIWDVKVGTRNNINAANIYVLEGDIHYQQHKYDEAEDRYDEAEKIYRRSFNSDHPEYIKVLSKLSKVYYMQGDYRKSKKTMEDAIGSYDVFIKEYFPALSEREKAKFWNTIRPDFEFFNTLAFTSIGEDPDVIEMVYNNALNTKALLLNSSIKIRQRIQNSKDGELIAKYNEWLTKKEQLTAALSMAVEDIEANELNTSALEEEVELLEKEISEKSELFASSFEEKNVTWENVQAALKPNEVAVEMIRFRHFDHSFTDSIIYAGLYITAESKKLPEYFLIKNGDELEGKYFKFYRNAIIFEMEDPYSYDQYWKPIQDAVGATSTMYLSADGVFNQINLEAIPTGDGKYVIDNSNIILVSNTKNIHLRSMRRDSQEPSQNAMMFGNPKFYAQKDGSMKIGQLPGTEREINQLHEILSGQGWRTDEYMNMEASEEQVKALNSPKVFHIATHGFFTSSEDVEANQSLLTQSEAQITQNPLLRTGLMMTGAGDLLDKTTFNYNIESGILTAYEAMNLNLDQTELVVLSACETGLGDVKAGEGVYGLQRAFLVAGAKTLIMSIFKVNDAATQELMTNFYRKWIDTGNKRRSFVEAKIELRNNPEFSSPKYWGAFLMLGMD